ncbi:MAG: hypothetical protein KDC53_17225 [Saprospiraceae bacterium]|nr:hypothetical protein [Saprospiraceae bacterium]
MKKIIAKKYYSGFPLAHDTYNALSSASDGCLYYVLSSEDIEIGGYLCKFNPENEEITIIGDLTEICGEKGNHTIGQGKSHVLFYEKDKSLYFGTHVGYYEMIDGMERLPANPPNNFGLYPGGHLLEYNMITGQFKDLAMLPYGEGLLTMVMDIDRSQIYGITWPTGHLIHYELNTGTLKDLGTISAKGEAGIPGDDFRVLCRSMVVDPRNGNVYFTRSNGDILYYHPEQETFSHLEAPTMQLDYFGQYDYKQPGNMGYNWRKAFWYSPENAIYGVHGNSGYLFKYSPDDQKIEIVERLTSIPSRRSGIFDQFSYGYLGFVLGPDQETIYYLTGGPIYEDGQRLKGEDKIAKGGAKGLENLHLITYHIPSEKYIDHGPIFYTDGGIPIYVNSIALDQEGAVYTLARMQHEGKEIEDLIRIPNPFKK